MTTKKESATNAQATEQRTPTDFKKELEKQLQELSRKKQLAGIIAKTKSTIFQNESYKNAQTA